MSNLEEQMKKFLETKGQSMAEKFQQMQANLANTRVTGKSGIDDEEKIFVQVIINGLQQVEEIKIGDGAFENGVKVTADLCKAATNDALEKLKSVMQKEVMHAYEQVDMSLPKEGDE